MAHVVRIFTTFTEASNFARYLAKRRRVELGVGRVDGQWHVTSAVPVEAPNYDQLESRLQEKDAEAVALHEQMAELQRQLQQVAIEKERFRRRVIEHEAKPASEVAEQFSRSHSRKPLPESTCEACGRTLTFCRCAG